MMKKFLILSAVLMAGILLSGDPVWAQDEGDGRDAARTKIELDPINFDMIKNGRPIGSVVVEIIIELKKSSDFEMINQRQPFLQSDFLQRLIALSKARFRLDRPINPDLVAAALKPVAEKRLGKDKIDLFVKNAVITPVSRR